MRGVWAVVVAGGSGQRFGQPKQFADLAGRPVVQWSVDACRTVADTVVVVLPPDRMDDLFGADLAAPGGPTRSSSVRSGLAAVAPEAEIVVVHDAARPLAAPALFAAVHDALADGRADGAICALAVADTLKRIEHVSVGHDGTVGLPRVLATVERAGLVAVQTPQAFRAQALRAAHAGDPEATDDAALVEALGATVRVVPGDPRNIKLTTPADLAYAEHLLGR
jgi:2-C-methyl-D-erythritol 4-phosphate cytidylyltransferase